MSVLLTPPVSGRRWSWLPLVTGLAVLDAVRSIDLPAAVTLGVKWPNDVLVDGAKVAGILAERVDDRRVVIGLGLLAVPSWSPSRGHWPEALVGSSRAAANS